ncbi:MAG TPA: nitroreductase [Clostridiales bacterium]|jgi:nitroreductase|nr:nitroreductase [Clostridiales bacterium]
MNMFDVLYSRKSVRSYTGRVPSEEQLKEILKAAWAAPVARARYADMHLTVIKDQRILSAVEENMGRIAGKEVHPLYGAPLLILVSVKPKQKEIVNNEYSSAAMIVHNMALAATALGLGSCDIWGCLQAANERTDIVEMYKLPEGFVACCGIVIGETQESFPLRDIPQEKISTDFID